MPLGSSWNLNSPCSVTTVWPALLPPCDRTTMSARWARKSTSLPLPSSPHCPPTTTMTTAGYLTAFGRAGAGFANGVPYPAMRRCEWAGSDPLMVAYHDLEWGVPARDDRTLFEFLTLEGAQAGLSWMTILRKRDGYRRAFANFDPEAVARFTDADVARLVADNSIVRNRAKIASAVANARAVLAFREERGSFAEHLWSFVGGRPLLPERHTLADLPSETPEARAISRDLKQRGFAFVGPTIVYSLMQSCGLVNDHVTDCFRHAELVTSVGFPLP